MRILCWFGWHGIESRVVDRSNNHETSEFYCTHCGFIEENQCTTFGTMTFSMDGKTKKLIDIKLEKL